MVFKESTRLLVDDLSDLLGGDWVGGEHLWRVGFHLDALSLIPLLSGLVEILLTIYEPRETALVFIVRSLDKTGTLFHDGVIQANRIQRYRKIDQEMMVLSDFVQTTDSLRD